MGVNAQMYRRWGFVAVIAALGAVAVPIQTGFAKEENKAENAESAEEAKKPKRELTEAEKQEKAARRVCKVKICGILRGRSSDGDVACDIVKTWHEDDVREMMENSRLKWPWGNARCQTKLNIKRDELAKAVSEAKHEVVMDKHDIACVLDRKTEKKETYNVTFSLAPKVTFEKGKATKASLNWGNITAPTLAKGVIWSATKLDNTFNVLQKHIVKMTNEFLTRKCDEVEKDLPGQTGAAQ